VLVLFFVFVRIAKFQDCENPLLDLYSLTEYTSPTSIDSSSIKYCLNIKTSQSTCCSADLINTFQARINKIKSRLLEKVIERDEYIWETQHQYLSQFQTIASQFSEAADQALPLLMKINSNSVTTLRQLITISKTVRDKSSSIINSFSDYQESRSKCIEELLPIHASLWCLACDPDYANRGVDSGPSISFDPTVSTKVASACYNYIINGVSQSALLQFRILLSLFEDLTVVLNLIANGQIYLNLNFDFSTAYTDDYTLPNLLPNLCTSGSNCAWALETLLTINGVDEDLLGYGGGPLGTIFGLSSTRRLEASRNLIGGTYWNPYDKKSLVDGSFSHNPAHLGSFSILAKNSLFFYFFTTLFIILI